MKRGATTNPIYDVVFVDGVCTDPPNIADASALTDIESLPLMLSRDGGQYGMSDNFTPPYGGRLSKGDLQDSALDTATSRSQRDWSGGRGLEAATAETNFYYDGLADTRYSGRLTLPPKVYGPYATGGAAGNHITLRWLRYGQYLYVVHAGKLYRSVFDENAVSGSSVIPNWTAISTNAIFSSATDIEMLESTARAGSYEANVIAVDGTAASSYFTEAGVLVGATSGRPKYLNTLGYASLGCVQFITAGETADTTNRPDLFGATGFAVLPALSNITANSIISVGGSKFVVCNFGIYQYTGSATMPKTLAWGQYESEDVGRINCTWRGAAYIASGESLIKFDGTGITNVGLDRDVLFPSTISKRVRMMVAGDDALYVLTGETGKTNAIWAMVSDGVFHCLYQSSSQIYSIGYDNRAGRHSTSGLAILQMQARLWWAIENNTYYMYVGRNQSNFSAVSPALGTTFYRGFASSGNVKFAAFGGEYSEIVKDIVDVVVTNSEAWPSGADVAASVEVDRSGNYHALTIKSTSANRKVFSVCSSSFAPKTVTAATLTTLTVDSVSDMAAGEFGRVNGQTFQIKSIATLTLTLVDALDEIPEVGAIVYASRPAGKEFRLKLDLSTSDSNVTPSILRTSVRYQDAIIGVGRFSLTIRLQDDMYSNSIGANYPSNSEALYAKLQQWARRSEPFWAIFPDGGAAWVRLTFLSRPRVVLSKPDQQNNKVTSVCSLNLVEVRR